MIWGALVTEKGFIYEVAKDAWHLNNGQNYCLPLHPPLCPPVHLPVHLPVRLLEFGLVLYMALLIRHGTRRMKRRTSKVGPQSILTPQKHLISHGICDCLANAEKKTDIMSCHLKPSCHTGDLEDPKCHIKKCACVCAYVNVGCCKGPKYYSLHELHVMKLQLKRVFKQRRELCRR